jgi:hypothetical protein
MIIEQLCEMIMNTHAETEESNLQMNPESYTFNPQKFVEANPKI